VAGHRICSRVCGIGPSAELTTGIAPSISRTGIMFFIVGVT
jgi:hypothetical protein